MTRTDLTRWNRRGLSKFAYVDGNAPVFLEYLRAAMIAKFARGLPASDEARQPDYWFDLLRDTDHPGPDDPRRTALLAALDWDALADGLAPLGIGTPETKAARNARLLNNYNAVSDDYAAEMMRASARAAHVLSGYIDAYMNEGYLATATQWSSLAKLGAMVNYAPAPAASAGTTVALTLTPDSGVVTIRRGLAMSAPPPGGGAPLIFETLSDITCHPDLNAARERRWNVNRSVMQVGDLNTWVLDGARPPSPGAPVVIAPGKFRDPSAKAMMVSQSRPGADGATVGVALQENPEGTWRKGYTEMWYDPETVVKGLIASRDGIVIVTVEKSASLKPGSVVEVRIGGRLRDTTAVVTYIQDDRVGLKPAEPFSQIEAIRPLTEFAIPAGYFDTNTFQHAYFNFGGSVFVVAPDADTAAMPGQVITGRPFYPEAGFIGYRFAKVGATWGGIKDTEGEWLDAAYIQHPPTITDALHDASAIVTFKGKPPKTLAVDSYFIARAADDSLTALRVRGFRVDTGVVHVAFNKAPGDVPEKTTFFGPMRAVIRPQDHDRSVHSIVDADGNVTLAGLSPDARALIQVGKRIIIEDKRETGLGSVLATVQKICDEPGNGQNKVESDQAKIVLTNIEFDLTAFIAGWTVFRLNTLTIGHGETKAGKTLGSGNGEVARQVMPLDVKGVSFVADANAATGVRPDIDVTVDGTLWDYSDLTDPAAEGSDAYTIRTRDDDTVDIVFRRRLATGRNNVRVSRHRVGAGRGGNGIGPFALTKPKGKHKHVTAVFQPFATAGGADRESTDSIRQNAGAAIAANDRAVSLADYTRLVQRHASIWDARAVEVIHAGRAPIVAVTVMPVDGVGLSTDQTSGLADYVTARAPEGVTATITHFTAVPVTLSAQIRIDPAMVTEDDALTLAAAALAAAFTLANRKLGQPLFVAEVLAVLEGLHGIETATTTLALGPSVVARPGLTFTSASGAIRAIHPFGSEVAFVAAATDVTVTMEQSA